MTLTQYFPRKYEEVVEIELDPDDNKIVMREIDHTVKEIDAALSKMISVAGAPQWLATGADHSELTELKRVVKN